MRFVERRHDVTALQIGDSVDRWCAGCLRLHPFEVLSVSPRAVIGRGACKENLSYVQNLALDHVVVAGD